MYQPTKDAIALPTYSFNRPDDWAEIAPPLSAMPEFLKRHDRREYSILTAFIWPHQCGDSSHLLAGCFLGETQRKSEIT